MNYSPHIISLKVTKFHAILLLEDFYWCLFTFWISSIANYQLWLVYSTSFMLSILHHLCTFTIFFQLSSLCHWMLYSLYGSLVHWFWCNSLLVVLLHPSTFSFNCLLMDVAIFKFFLGNRRVWRSFSSKPGFWHSWYWVPIRGNNFLIRWWCYDYVQIFNVLK